ncbi:zinc-binding dehydrogenase [Prauserella shujinwangii]|uniref:Zinc-binding dehydrogenase n=2 Tax=Prauserella shujinwangii TaxID=1453103 RepID=A0A2T0M3T9_9PSEU|nr:zinc-binding dehydrogenase [Prauserella shujinwangii]
MRGLGLELAGEIESAGREVRRFRRGDVGACADYQCLPEKASLARKPANVTHEEAAAAVDGATTALFFLRDKGNIRGGEKVLVNGASGGIGTYAVQLAKLFGAEVTGVCSGRNAELVRFLGAEHVIDRTREDFTRNGPRYGIVFDTVGAVRSPPAAARSPAPAVTSPRWRWATTPVRSGRGRVPARA